MENFILQCLFVAAMVVLIFKFSTDNPLVKKITKLSETLHKERLDRNHLYSKLVSTKSELVQHQRAMEELSEKHIKLEQELADYKQTDQFMTEAQNIKSVVGTIIGMMPVEILEKIKDGTFSGMKITFQEIEPKPMPESGYVDSGMDEAPAAMSIVKENETTAEASQVEVQGPEILSGDLPKAQIEILGHKFFDGDKAMIKWKSNPEPKEEVIHITTGTDGVTPRWTVVGCQVEDVEDEIESIQPVHQV